jgi:hypothetical protein
MRAHALMQHPLELEAIYTSSPLYERRHRDIDAIRFRLPDRLPQCYRGIGRYPFTEYPQRGPGWQWSGASTDDTEPEARKLMLGFLGADDYEAKSPRAFLEHAGHMKAVLAALHSTTYEMVELCTGAEHPQNLLGFDVGYWGRGNFSILCDVVVWPVWHPPTRDTLPLAAHTFRELNAHCLFPTQRAAEIYLDWYRLQSWAETEAEPGEFTVIGVGSTA